MDPLQTPTVFIVDDDAAVLKSLARVLFVTGHGDVPTSVAGDEGRTFDFLEKPVDEQLAEAVRLAIAQSETSMSDERERREFLARRGRLTPRERQVCDQVVRGQVNKQIAYDLGLSEKTIKVHRARFMRKLAVGSVAELARLLERTSSTPNRTQR